MPTLTGTVRAADQPAGWAYVQVRNPTGDFQGEVRADATGRFSLYPRPGHWRLVAWTPRLGQTELDVRVDEVDLEVDLHLPGPSEREGT